MLGPWAGGTAAFSRALLLIAVSLSAQMAGFGRTACARDFVSDQVRFEIPSQPLANALEAYSAMSGLDVFYNADLAERRRSHAVIGTYTPAQAIAIMLEGSGYVARVTAPGALAIVSKVAGQPAKSETGADARYETYFSSMQERLGEVLCALPRTPGDGRDMLLRIWLRPSGDVARADVLGEGDKADERLANAVARARFVAPPAGMPQPVTLVVFRASSGVDPQCTVPLGRAVRQ